MVVIIAFLVGCARGGERPEVVPAREIERPLHLPARWLEGGLAYEAVSLSAGGAGHRGSTSRVTAGMAYGVSSTFGLRVAVDGVRGRLEEERSIRGGRVLLGGTSRVLWRDAPLRSLVVDMDIVSPALSDRSTILLGPPSEAGLGSLNLPVWSARTGVRAKRDLAPFSIAGGLRWEQTLPLRADLVVDGEPQGRSTLSSFGAGDAWTRLDLQLGPVVLGGGARAGASSALRWSSPEAASPNRLPDTSGVWLLPQLRARLHLTRALDLDLSWAHRVVGPEPGLGLATGLAPLPGSLWACAIQARELAGKRARRGR